MYYLTNIFHYFEQVLNPAEGRTLFLKKKSKSTYTGSRSSTSPEASNLRSYVVTKQEKMRRNPAP